jgi:hypothetical protein
MRSVMMLPMCLSLFLVSGTATVFAGLEYDFENGNLDDWEINENDAGTWEIVDGRLRVAAEAQYTRILVGDPDWTDYTYEVTATRVSENYPCILFRAEDFETCYDYEASYGSNTLAVFKGTGDLWNGVEITPGGRPPFTGSDEDTHVYKIEVRGDNIKCYLDDELVMDFNDTDAIMAGRVGLASYSNSIIDYDDVTISGDGIGAVDASDKLFSVWGALKVSKKLF